MSDDEIAAVVDGDWRDNPAFSAAEQTALAYAEAVTATPPHVDDALFARLREHFEPPQIVQIAATIAWENYRSRLNDALGVEGQGFYAPKR